MTQHAITFAWNTFKKHMGLLTAIALTFLGVWVALEMIVIAGQQFGLLWWTVAHLAFFIVFAGVEVGFIKVCLDLYDGKEPTYFDTFRYMPLAFKFLVTQMLYLLIITVGLVFLIVPGLYTGVRYAFAGFCLIEDELGLRESFGHSARLVEGNKFHLLTIIAALLIFNLIGACLLGIGLLVTVPLSTLVMVSIYRQRKNKFMEKQRE